MSAPTASSAPPTAPPPRLESGDHLTRDEFERLYAGVLDRKAELIDGVVYMASPTSEPHSLWHGLVTTWLGLYAARTPGTQFLPEASLRLPGDSEPKPDAMLRVDPLRGGLSRTDPDRYVAGPVELVVEVALTSRAYDLHSKKAVYERHGCLEYLVLVVEPRDLIWHVLRDGRYRQHSSRGDGVYASAALPGLWLDAPALLAGDMARVLDVLEEGLERPEHAAFVAALAASKP